LGQAVVFFGADTELSRLTKAWLGRYLKSPALLAKPNGEQRARPGVDRARRVFRALLVWAAEQGGFGGPAPLPASEARYARKQQHSS